MTTNRVDRMRGSSQEIVLADLARKYIGKADFVFVEIGVWSGLTAQYMLREFPEMFYYGIDPYLGFYNASQELCDEARALAEERLAPFPNAGLVLDSSVEAAIHFDDCSIDLLFIDANHHYQDCLQDMRSWWLQTRRVMAGHDLIDADVKRAVEDFCREMGITYTDGGAKTWYIIKEG